MPVSLEVVSSIDCMELYENLNIFCETLVLKIFTVKCAPGKHLSNFILFHAYI